MDRALGIDATTSFGTRPSARAHFVIIPIALIDWPTRINQVCQEMSPLRPDPEGIKLSRLIQLADEIREDESSSGILGLLRLAKQIDDLTFSKAEELCVEALLRVEHHHQNFKIAVLLEVGCFYSKHSLLNKAEPPFSEALSKFKRWKDFRNTCKSHRGLSAFSSLPEGAQLPCDVQMALPFF